MKPDWDALAQEYEGSQDKLIADVDCTGSGESLCSVHGIEGFPTLKWGDPSSLHDYEGGRDFDSLKAFAEEHLKPQCSPSNMELCDAAKRKEIEKYMAMDPARLQLDIAEREAKLSQVDKDFEEFIQGLQKQYEEMMEKVQKEKDEIKQSGLGLMKAVRAKMVKDEKSKDEL